MLTHLITDASTAVGTAADGTLPNIPLPQMSPLEPSDFEQSSSEEGDEGYELGEEQDINDMAIADHEEQLLEDEEMDDRHRLYLSESPAHSFGDDNQSEDEQSGLNSLRYRTGSRSSLRPNRSANRLSSLFMELQNTQSNDPTLEDPDKSSGVSGSLGDELPAEYERRPRKSTSSTSLSSSAGKIRRLSVITKKPSMEMTSPSEPLEAQSTSVAPRYRSSFSSLRSPRLQLPRTDELQETHQMEVELDRTVETIDGLTRELVAVATHQNWMQMKLQRTLQFQKQQVEQIESSLSTATTASANLRSLPFSSTGDQASHPLEDLSRSLKQVAVSVGKVIASTTKPTMSSLPSSSVPADQGTLRTRLPQQKGNLSRVDTRTVSKPRFGKEFSKYFQELEKIAALGSKLGFGKVDGLNENDDIEGAQNQETLEDAQNQELPSYGSRSTTGPSSPTSIAPPDLEDFAAQCRLLTRALVLPFVQLTHHAMTSQDSVLALSPTTRAIDQSAEWDSLNMEESFEHRSIHSRDTSYHSATEESFSPRMSPGTHQSSAAHRHSSTDPWPSSPLFSGGDLDSILGTHGSELSPDSIVKAKTIISTGLYLIHLLYWTVLFVIGSLVLDSWLAETAGQQVIRIVDQVREALVAAGIGAPRIEGQDAKILGTVDEPPFFAKSDEHLYEHQEDVLQMEHLSLDSYRDPLASLTPISERSYPESLTAARIQSLEDRAIEVAVGLETLKNRLSGPSSPISTSRPGSGLWGRKDSFQSTSSAFSSTLSATGTDSPEPDKMGGLMRTGSWVGPRRRRLTHNKDSKTRRFSSASRTPITPVVVPRSVEGMTGNGRRPRPMSHWGSFSPAIDFGAVSSPSSHEPSSTSMLHSTASSSTTLSDWATAAGVSLAKDFGLIATATATMPETVNVVTVASISAPRSRRNSM